MYDIIKRANQLRISTEIKILFSKAISRVHPMLKLQKCRLRSLDNMSGPLLLCDSALGSSPPPPP